MGAVVPKTKCATFGSNPSGFRSYALELRPRFTHKGQRDRKPSV
jgi:hypothetical protein